MLASSKSLHDAAIFPHFLNSRTQRFAKGKSGDWNRIYFISRQMGISRAWKNIKGLSSSYNENYYCSAKSTRTIAHMCNTMNSRWWKWWRESHHCCLHFWIGKLLPTGIDVIFQVSRNFCQGKLKPFVTCPSSIFQYFFHSYWGNVHPFTRCSTLTQSHKLKILQKELL